MEILNIVLGEQSSWRREVRARRLPPNFENTESEGRGDTRKLETTFCILKR